MWVRIHIKIIISTQWPTFISRYTLSFSLGIGENRFIKQGESIGYILLDRSSDRYISAAFASNNIGNIKSGQRAIVRFDAYPYKEFGSVISEVRSIGKIPLIDRNRQSTSEIRIPIEDTIITDHRDTIFFRPNMIATIEIITEDKTVFHRIFNQLTSLL